MKTKSAETKATLRFCAKKKSRTMIQLYECPKCGLQVERLEKSDEDSEPPVCSDGLRKDEKCRKLHLSSVHVFEKKIGRPNAHFKGSDFYVNEYDDSSNPASNT